jgi:hypothetical protein
METVPDFEDLLELFDKFDVRYLIIGGMAFIYHAKPRYTKDIDFWVENTPVNIHSANKALAEFGSPTLLDEDNPEQVLQIDLAPNRIDILVEVGPITFQEAWEKRIRASYGNAKAYWIDLDSLLQIKSAIDHPKHQEDARILKEVKNRKNRG